MNWKHGVAGVLTIAFVAVILAPSGSAEADFDEATVHFSPDCGCCVQHANYLERAGVDVERVEHSNAELQMIAEDLNVPENYRSCHITELEDQKVKGHVPIEVFNQIVDEEPDADVITLPGMPSGSPGMPGAKSSEWIFFQIIDGEVEGEFTKR